jgi:hypothetical protein
MVGIVRKLVSRLPLLKGQDIMGIQCRSKRGTKSHQWSTISVEAGIQSG